MFQLIIYGAGKRGQGYFDLFKNHGIEKYIYGFCDKNYNNIPFVGDKKVYSYDEVKDSGIPFLISLIDKDQVESIKNLLISDGNTIIDADDICECFGYNDRVEFNRMLCAFFHIRSMDSYFTSSENTLSVFWNEDSVFKKYFDSLDCSKIIEIACGKGRHVTQYIGNASEVTLVDILPENIDFCRERFKEFDNIHYYCNNGYDLEKLDNESCTAIFSYDAMVHFEMMDIYSYLKEFLRVLVPGGRALIHHSNNSLDYKASFANAPHGRAFMSSKLFAHLAYKCGFKVISQTVIDWGIKDLDCISLIEKSKGA